MIRIAVFACLLVTAGCAETHAVRFSAIAPEVADEIASLSEEKTADVTLVSGDAIHVKSIKFRPGTVDWLDPTTGGVLPAPGLSEIDEIRFDGAGIVGPGKGALLGTLAGLAVAVGYAASTEGWDELGAIVFPPLGALVGLFVGGSSDRVYHAARESR